MRVRRDAAAQQYPLHAVFLHRFQRPPDHRVNYRLLESQRDLRNLGLVRLGVILRWVHPLRLGPSQHGGLQAAEAEVQRVPDPRPRQVGFQPDGSLGVLLYLRSARESESQHARRLVERLARRVVSRSAYQRVVAVALHQNQVGMPARGYQAHQREAGPRFRVNALFQPGGVHVALQVVDADERQVVRQRQPLRGVHPDQERARQSGPVRDRHAVQFGQLHARLLHRLSDHRQQRLHMLARGYLRHDAAVLGVHLHLCGDHVGDDISPVLDDRRRRLVAGCLYAQYPHVCLAISLALRFRAAGTDARPRPPR